jgi:NADH:ubiquinone oxidoreductase subunit
MRDWIHARDPTIPPSAKKENNDATKEKKENNDGTKEKKENKDAIKENTPR